MYLAMACVSIQALRVIGPGLRPAKHTRANAVSALQAPFHTLCTHLGKGAAMLMREALAIGVDVNNRADDIGWRPLERCIGSGSMHALRALLDSGSVDFTPVTGPQGSYLHVGVLFNRAAMLRVVLAAAEARGVRIDLNARDDQGRPPLAKCGSSSARAVEVLVTRGADLHRFCPATVNGARARVSVAAHAIHDGAASALRVMLQHGLHPDMPATSHETATLLHMAVTACGNAAGTPPSLQLERCIEVLLEAGADPWLYGEDGLTALHSGIVRLPVVLLRKVLQAAAALADRHDPLAGSAADSGAACGTAGAATTASAFVRLLCQPLPAKVECRLAADGDVWSPATARRVVRRTKLVGTSVLHAAVFRPPTGVYLRPEYRVDKVVQLLLEFGAGGCVNVAASLPNTGGTAVPVMYVVATMVHAQILSPGNIALATALAGALEALEPYADPASWHTQWLPGLTCVTYLTGAVIALAAPPRWLQEAPHALRESIATRVSALLERVGDGPGATGAAAPASKA